MPRHARRKVRGALFYMPRYPSSQMAINSYYGGPYVLNYKYGNLNYLKNKPKTIRWKVIVGSRELSFYESYDLVYDQYDLKIRQLKC